VPYRVAAPRVVPEPSAWDTVLEVVEDGEELLWAGRARQAPGWWLPSHARRAHTFHALTTVRAFIYRADWDTIQTMDLVNSEVTAKAPGMICFGEPARRRRGGGVNLFGGPWDVDWGPFDDDSARRVLATLRDVQRALRSQIR
jgi:hypothetical protein